MGYQCVDLIKKETGHAHALLTSRGNAAISLAIRAVEETTDKRNVIIPDQGGWLTYPDIPKTYGMESIEVKTDLGVMLPDEIKKTLPAAAVLYANPAGYFAHQPIQDIPSLKEEQSAIKYIQCSLGE